MYMIAEVLQYVAVASFLEAWIEIGIYWRFCKCNSVASFLEAWIEIQCSCIDRAEVFVASFLETWIEII